MPVEYAANCKRYATGNKQISVLWVTFVIKKKIAFISGFAVQDRLFENSLEGDVLYS
jgi:hypothetical protein